MTGPRLAVVILSALALGCAGFYILLPKIIQLLVRAILTLRYSVTITGLENLPRTGPVLITANHVTWVDGFFLAGFIPRRGKAMVNAGLVSFPVFKQLTIRAGIIPVPYKGPGAIRAALDAARTELQRGACLGIFPEGQISRTGFLNPFYRGMEVIVRGIDDIVVVPVALDNLWGSFFSRSGGHFFRKWPVGWRRKVRIAFGPPLKPPITAFAARQALMAAMVKAREIAPGPVVPPDTVDLTLPHWEHPTLGLLTASTQDVVLEDINQVGSKPGTVGHPLPGIAIRSVDESGTLLGPGKEGRLEALVPHQQGWVDTGQRGRIESDGFVRFAAEPDA